jgi:hypothetical protein
MSHASDPPHAAAAPSRARSALAVYVGRIRDFDGVDWLVYLAWVGTMVAVVIATGGFLLLGRHHGVVFPAAAWWVPTGAALFALAIAIDTIGHLTIYKTVLRGGEQLVHHVTIVCGVASCVLLVLAYSHPAAAIPALVFTILAFVYSLIDEAFHWRRYTSQQSDPVEMWSHVGIFVGHGTMMLGWWLYYRAGYPGVRETLAALSG